MKSIDPQSVRVPLGVRKIVDAAIAIEREECAKVCDTLSSQWPIECNHFDQCAEAIRLRSNVK